MTLLERLGGRETVTRGIVDTFRAISRPPHPSGQEGAAADAVAALLSGLGLGTERDGAGNLLCRVPPPPGGRARRSWCSRATWTWCAPPPPAAAGTPKPTR